MDSPMTIILVGNSKKEQTYLIQPVSCLINKGLFAGRPRQINGWSGYFAIYKKQNKCSKSIFSFLELATVMRMTPPVSFKNTSYLVCIKCPILDTQNKINSRLQNYWLAVLYFDWLKLPSLHTCQAYMQSFSSENCVYPKIRAADSCKKPTVRLKK